MSALANFNNMQQQHIKVRSNLIGRAGSNHIVVEDQLQNFQDQSQQKDVTSYDFSPEVHVCDDGVFSSNINDESNMRPVSTQQTSPVLAQLQYQKSRTQNVTATDGARNVLNQDIQFDVFKNEDQKSQYSKIDSVIDNLQAQRPMRKYRQQVNQQPVQQKKTLQKRQSRQQVLAISDVNIPGQAERMDNRKALVHEQKRSYNALYEQEQFNV